MRAFVILPAILLTASIAMAQAPATPAPSWNQLLEKQKEMVERLQEIQKVAPTAKPEEQQKYIAEFQQIVETLTKQIFPEMEKQLPAQLAAHPDDEQVLGIAQEILQISYLQNRFDDCQKLADTLRAKNPEDALAVNLAGICRFANHQFADAEAILTAAREKGVLIDELGGRYLDNSSKYVDYWKQEQALRAKEDAAQGDQQLPRVKLETSRGDIVLELFENEAPNAVANYIDLVNKGFYNGLAFHRVIPDFMIQGGCPNSRQEGSPLVGTGGPGYNIKCECDQPNARRHFSGSLSMAHAGKDTGGSQFFITHLPTPHLDRDGGNPAGHTVFGRVVEGLDVARGIQANDKINSAKVIRQRNHEYKPETIPE